MVDIQLNDLEFDFVPPWLMFFVTLVLAKSGECMRVWHVVNTQSY